MWKCRLTQTLGNEVYSVSSDMNAMMIQVMFYIFFVTTILITICCIPCLLLTLKRRLEDIVLYKKVVALYYRDKENKLIKKLKESAVPYRDTIENIGHKVTKKIPFSADLREGKTKDWDMTPSLSKLTEIQEKSAASGIMRHTEDDRNGAQRVMNENGFGSNSTTSSKKLGDTDKSSGMEFYDKDKKESSTLTDKTVSKLFVAMEEDEQQEDTQGEPVFKSKKDSVSDILKRSKFKSIEET